MVRVENIKKSFGNLEVLKGISFEIEKASINAIVGTSGAGKTTLLQIIGTLQKPDYGNVIINNQDISIFNSNELAHFRNNEIGFVFQFHQLLPEFTALENVSIPALINGLNKKDSQLKAKELLELLNLKDRLTHKPSALSGGEKQRVAIARALINNPSVILADEPSGNLDSKNASELFEIFFELREKTGQTFIIVTHNDKHAKLTDKIMHISDGIIS